MFRYLYESILIMGVFTAFIFAVPFLVLNQVAPTAGLSYQVKIVKTR